MNKILSRRELKEILDQERPRGKRIVFTNGCFDLLHVGHIACLREAKRHGDILVVGLNSDTSVASIKGPSRPIVPEAERAAIVAALEPVDFVTLFEEDTPQDLIAYLQPHVLVKGGDWKKADIAGSDIVEDVVIVPSVVGVSTTDIIARIEERLLSKR
ncbi:MAG TPA: D-glycero-beta-D-manno-heptose 1-phosphate adenylyltransferase [Deltaproteobacteria bacterium]|nr:D-glycero-beta-D-manno-heptose 1-phosphate adenylyltransferase [Deltaproteobacteria bacterium]